MRWRNNCCSWSYWETAGSFPKRKKHVNNVKTAAKDSRIANHAWSHNHDIDFDNTFIIDKGNYSVRKSLDFWHTMKISNRDKNSCLLPREEKSLCDGATVAKFLDDNKLKTSLEIKKWIRTVTNCFIHFVKCWRNFLRLNPKGPYLS